MAEQNTSSQSKPSHLSRVRGRGRGRIDPHTAKALYLFGVPDLRDLLNRKHEEGQSENRPPPDPSYSYLKDPLREDSYQGLEDGQKKQVRQLRSRSGDPGSRTPRGRYNSRSSERIPHSSKPQFIKNPSNIQVELTMSTGLKNYKIDKDKKIADIRHMPDEKFADLRTSKNINSKSRTLNNVDNDTETNNVSLNHVNVPLHGRGSYEREGSTAIGGESEDLKVWGEIDGNVEFKGSGGEFRGRGEFLGMRRGFRRGRSSELRGGKGEFRGSGEFRGGRREFGGGRGEVRDYRNGRGEFRGGSGEFRRGRGEFRGGRGEFRGGRGAFKEGKGEFRERREEFSDRSGEFRGGRPAFRGGRGEFRRKGEFKGARTELVGTSNNFEISGTSNRSNLRNRGNRGSFRGRQSTDTDYISEQNQVDEISQKSINSDDSSLQKGRLKENADTDEQHSEEQLTEIDQASVDEYNASYEDVEGQQYDISLQENESILQPTPLDNSVIDTNLVVTTSSKGESKKRIVRFDLDNP